MSDKLKTCELYNCEVPYLKDFFNTCKYPWEMLSKINSLTLSLCQQGLDGFTEIKPDVFIGKDVSIADTATIEAPAIIGHGTEIRPGAYLRGNVITGENCVLGNSSEFKNCILRFRLLTTIMWVIPFWETRLTWERALFVPI